MTQAPIQKASSIDCTLVAKEWLDRLHKASVARNPAAFAELFISAGWLRDLLCFGWDFRTIQGRDQIVSYLSETVPNGNTKANRLAKSSISKLTVETFSSLGPPSLFPLPGAPDSVSGVQAVFTFELDNPARTGRGFVRLVQAPGDSDDSGVAPHWKALTAFFNSEDLKDYTEPKERPSGVFEGHMVAWPDVRAQMAKSVEEDPTVLIIGAGQGGLMCAARMGRMGIRALLVEKLPRVGDVWRNRYPNLSLHTPAHFCTNVSWVPLIVLYHPWPKTYPKYMAKDMVANFLESYAYENNLVIWLSSTVLNDPQPVYNEETGRWSVHVERTIKTESFEVKSIVTLHPKHVVLATGSGRAHIPKWPGMASFKGTIYHSDNHKSPEKWAGKKAVIIGACNAAGDVAQSFVAPAHPAASVTVVQRSATCVVAASSLDAVFYSEFYPESRPIEDADLLDGSMPLRFLLNMFRDGLTARLKEMDNALLTGLQEHGFKLNYELEPGAGEVGLPGFLHERRGSGSMLDVGFGQSVIEGKVNIKSGTEVDHFESDAIVFQDGTRVEADVVVLATGNKPIIDNATDLFGKDITKKIGNQIWGLDKEGEFMKTFRPTGQRGLWFVAGPFAQGRFFSKHLAIQILAEEHGLKN